MKRWHARRIREGILYGRAFAVHLEGQRPARALGTLLVFLLGGVIEAEGQAFMRTAGKRLDMAGY